MSFIRVMRSKRRLATAGAVLFAAAGTGLFFGPRAEATTSGTGSTQTVTFTPSALLTITATAASLGGVTTGSSVPITLGSVVVQDTEQDSTTWTASVAASDCFPPTVQTAGSTSNVLPASAITLNPGTGPVAPTATLSTSPVSATLGSGGAFSDPTTAGTLATPNYGTAQTLASAAPVSGDALSNDGTYTLSPSLSLNLTGTSGFLAVPSTYTCSLQYTITG